MNEHNKKAFESAFPDVPQAFDFAMRKTLEEIQMKNAKRATLRTCLLVGLALMVMCGAALALTGNINLFNFFDFSQPYQTVQPDAYKLTQSDAASYDFDHVTVSIKEAAWDGRVMRVMYSIRDRAATGRFDDESVQNQTYAFPAADADGIRAYNGCDWMYINGESVCLTGYMSSRAGEQNGEILVALESDLSQRLPVDAPNVTLGDSFTVSLPIQLRRNADGSIYVGENGFENLTPDALTFTVQNTNLAGVRDVRLPQSVRFDDYTFNVTMLKITPIRVYLMADIVVDEGCDYDRTEVIASNWADAVLGDGKGQNLMSFECGYGQVGVKVDVVDGECVYTLPEGDVHIELDMTFITAETYPETFVLTGKDGKQITIPNTAL